MSPAYSGRDDGLSSDFLSDRRDFPQILEDWMTHEVGVGPREGQIHLFLEKTGLSQWIKPEEIRRILTQEAVPGRNLSLLLSLYLPGHVLRRDEEPIPDTGPRKFRNRAAYWLKSNTETTPRDPQPKISSTIDLPEEKFDAFRIHILKKFRELIPTSPATNAEVKTEPPAANTPAPGARIIARLMEAAAIAKKGNYSPNEEEIRETFAELCKKSRKKMHAFLGRMKFPDDEIRQFLDSLVPERDLPPAAQSLAFLRHSRGITQVALGMKIGVNPIEISRWERGVSSISAKYFPSLSDALGSPKEIWYNLLYPALNDAWLDKQPPEKQAGMLLQAFRRKVGLSRQKLAELLKISDTTLLLLESGGEPVLPKHIPLFTKALNLSSKDIRNLEKRLLPQAPPLTEEAKHAAMTFAFLCEQQKISPKKLAKKLATDVASVKALRSALIPILPEYIPSFADALDLSPAIRREFTKTIESAHKIRMRASNTEIGAISAKAHPKLAHLIKNQADRARE